MIPTVTVCVLTYNQEPFIAQALEGILSQAMEYPFEVLVGEDESSDGTREVCELFSARYPDSIKIVQGSRNEVIYIEGVATGRANLIRLLGAARGKYIALCEGDDYWTFPGKLRAQVSFLEENPTYSGSCHQTASYQPDGSTGRIFGEGLQQDLSAEDVLTKWSPFHTSSFVFRSDSLPTPLPEWFTRVLSGDMALFAMVAAKGRIRFFPNLWSVYRRHTSSLTNNPQFVANLHADRVRLMTFLGEFFEDAHKERIELVRDFHSLSGRLSKLQEFNNSLKEKNDRLQHELDDMAWVRSSRYFRLCSRFRSMWRANKG